MENTNDSQEKTPISIDEYLEKNYPQKSETKEETPPDKQQENPNADSKPLKESGSKENKKDPLKEENGTFYFKGYNQEEVSEEKPLKQKEKTVEPGLSDEKVIEFLKEKGITLSNLDELKKTKEKSKEVINEDLLRAQKFIANGGSWDDLAKLQKDPDKIDRIELIKDYMKEELNYGDKRIDLKIKRLQLKKLPDEEFADEDTIQEINSHNEEATAEEEDLYLKALKHFNKKKENFAINFSTPSKDEIIKQQQQLKEEYFNILDNNINAIKDLEIKDAKGETIFKNTYTAKEKKEMNEYAKSAGEFINSFFEKNQLKKESAGYFQENIAWANPEFRKKKIQQITKNAIDFGVELQSKKKRNITLDQKSAPTSSLDLDNQGLKTALQNAFPKLNFT